METHKKILTAVSAIVMSLTVVGCGGSFGSADSDALNEQNLNESVDFSKLNGQIDALGLSLDDLTKELEALNIIKLGSQGDAGKSLAAKFKLMINQITGGVLQARQLIDQHRVNLEAKLALLSQNNPKYDEIKQKIDEALAYLDNVESYLDQATSKIISFMDAIVLKVDGLVDSIDSGSPLKVVASLVWSTVRTEIIAARDELAS